MFMISRWPSTRMISARPEIRMNSQLLSSMLLRRAAGRFGARGFARARSAMSVTPEERFDGALQHEEGTGDHHDDPDHADHPEHGLLQLRALRPEVDQHDADAVQRVEEDRADQA